MKRDDLQDSRWGSYKPLIFRTSVDDIVATVEQYYTFWSRVSKALKRHFAYNEPQINNLNHFEASLISETLNRYKPPYENSLTAPSQIAGYFNEEIILKSAFPKTTDQELALMLRGIDIRNINTLKSNPEGTKRFLQLSHERLYCLEVLLRNLPETNPGVIKLKQQINTFLVESKISIIFDLDNNLFLPLEEPLLQKEINNLLPRLSKISSERTDEFVQAYHDMLAGKKPDDIFISAFKTLEEIARQLNNNPDFQFNDKDLKKYYPKLHKTIHKSILYLAAHRGDQAGHGRKAPFEIRYILFSIINIALLLIDYHDANHSK